MDPQEAFSKIIPKGFAHRLMIITSVCLVANLLIFYTVGANNDRDKIYNYHSEEFYIGGPDDTNSTGTSDEPVMMEQADSEDQLIYRMTHSPIGRNSSGDISVDLLMVHQEDWGRIIGVDLVYKIEDSIEHKIKMINKFQKVYNESIWKAGINIPENVNWSYRFCVRYTPRLTDVYRFYDRAETAASGGIIYRDTRYRTETPPLINYLLIPGYLLSKHTDPTTGFSIYFICFAVISSICVYILFRRWGDDRAFTMAMILAFYPFMFKGAYSAQDEPLLAFFFIVPFFLIMIGKIRLSGLMIGIGICIKMWTILLIPGLLSCSFSHEVRGMRNKEMVIDIIYILVPILLIFLPFLFLAGSDFTFFLSTYSGLKPHPTICSTIWYSLFHGSDVYWIVKLILLGLISVLTLLMLRYANKFQVHPLRMSMAFVALFFLFYFKILPSYYIFLTIIFLPAMTEDWELLVEMFAIPILLLSRFILPDLPILILVWLIVLDILRRSLVKPYIFDRDLGDGAKHRSYGTFFDKMINWDLMNTNKRG